MKEKYGDLELRLEGKKEKDVRMGYYPEGDLGMGRDTMKHFIKTYRNSKKYIVSELPSPMYHEAGVLPFMGCSPLRDSIVEVDIWLNGNNASSIMHKDAFNQLNCLYNGTKVWKLISFEHEDKVYKRFEPEARVGGFSMINVSAVDLLRYLKFAEVPWQYTVLNAGDCLYLPGSMYHQVQSYGSHNLAVSLLFRRLQFANDTRVDFGKCANESLNVETLDKFEPDWAYIGTGMMSMGNSGFDAHRILISDLYSRKTGKLSKKRILKLLSLKSKLKKKEPKEHAKRVYQKLTRTIGSKNPPSEMMLSNKSFIREIALEFEAIEPSNTYDMEYSFVDLKKNLKKALKPYFTAHNRGKSFDPEPDYDPGDIERAQRLDYQTRMEEINKADDPRAIDEQDFEDLRELVEELRDDDDDDDDDDVRKDEKRHSLQDEKFEKHANKLPESVPRDESDESSTNNYRLGRNERLNSPEYNKTGSEKRKANVEEDTDNGNIISRDLRSSESSAKPEKSYNIGSGKKDEL